MRKKLRRLPEDGQRRRMGTWTTGRRTDFVRRVDMPELVLPDTSGGGSVLVGEDAENTSGNGLSFCYVLLRYQF